MGRFRRSRKHILSRHQSDLYTRVNGSVNAGGDGNFVQNRQTWQYTDYMTSSGQVIR